VCGEPHNQYTSRRLQLCLSLPFLLVVFAKHAQSCLYAYGLSEPQKQVGVFQCPHGVVNTYKIAVVLIDCIVLKYGKLL
jgi:hypothetical protein